MGLVGSSAADTEVGSDPGLEPSMGEQDTATVEPLAILGQEAVPLRERHPDDFEQEREQRIEALVGRRRQRVPRPGRRARMLAAGGVAIGVVVLVAVLSTTDQHSSREQEAARISEPQADAASVAHRAGRRRQPLVKAHPQRRAAIPTKRRAARRHAQRERAHRQAAKVEDVPTQSEAPVTESQAPASAPAPVATTTESAPPPASSPPPSTSSNPAGEEFGFER